MAAETIVLTAQVPLELAARLEAIAARLGRSPGWVVKQALEVWVAREEECHGLTLQALADVDNHRLIDHQVVQAWADSLGTDSPLPAPGEG